MNIYKCLKCGNVIELLNGSNSITCCGENMEKLIANSVDASLEKHVPKVEILDDIINVTVGEVIHPSEENHYIMWIAMVKGNKIERINLKPGEKPIAKFKYIKGSTIYAYCNLHGLWKKEID